MSNRIVNVELVQKRATPAVAELWVVLTPERLTPTTEVRGKLVGPHCPGVTTVEVAYPLQPAPQTPGTVTRRAVVPQANLWTPATPFEYEVTVELWQDGERSDQRSVTTRFKTD